MQIFVNCREVDIISGHIDDRCFPTSSFPQGAHRDEGRHCHDSCASIPESLLEALNIHWVPYYIHRGTEVLRDLVTIQRQAFYNWLPTAKELPQTASPGPGEYLTMYQRLAEQGVHEIVSIHMTSKGAAHTRRLRQPNRW
jgi:hypothetical protein